MSSKRRLRKRSCTGKKRYDNRPTAWIAVHALRRKSSERGRNLSIYKCKFCKKWHIGHKPRRKVRHQAS